MKTRFLIIIGIVLTSAVIGSLYTIYDSSTLVFVECVPPHEQVDGKCIMPTFKLLLDDTIPLNDPLIISVEKTGYYMCDEWRASIVDTENNSITWEKVSHTSCVTANFSKPQKFVYEISNQINPVMIDDSGKYLFQIDIGGKILEQEFHVMHPNSWYNNRLSDVDLQTVMDSCSNDSPKERMTNTLRYTNDTHVFLNLDCKWEKIGTFVGE